MVDYDLFHFVIDGVNVLALHDRAEVSGHGESPAVRGGGVPGRGLLPGRALRLLLQRAQELPARAPEGEVPHQGLPPQHRPRGQRLSQHIEGRLEASAHNQLDSVRSSISISGEFWVLEEY